MKTYSFWINKFRIIEINYLKNKLWVLNKVESYHKKQNKCIYLISLKRYLSKMIFPTDGNNCLIKDHY